jgi:hypothetical protein
MEYAYQPTEWHDFYLCVGPSAAALVGLIFVAFSMRSEGIKPSPVWRGRAIGGIAALLALVVMSILLLVPAQPRPLLGGEITLLAATNLVRGVSNQRRRLHAAGLPRLPVSGILLDIGFTLLLVGGLSVAIGRYGGLLWLPAPIVILVVYAVYNSWQLVFVGVEAEDHRPSAKTDPS